MQMKRIIAIIVILVGSAFIGCRSASNASREVVAYVSEDQVFSEPVLKDFEKETGVRVKAIFDTEEAKSTGAMNRLIAEKDNPQADVYWANEPIRAEALRTRGIAAPYVSPAAADIPATFKDPEGYWTGFSARARVLVVSRKTKAKPASILAYADPRWKGKAVLANPLFGTTTAQMAALFTIWPKHRAERFLDDMKKNGAKMSTSNGESADLVASGEFEFALVDSDDGVSRLKQGRPIEMVYPDQEEGGIGCFIVPNAVLLVTNGPHPDMGKRLVDYLLSKETERKLAFAECAQIPLHPGVPTPPEVKSVGSLRTMQVSYAEVAGKMQEIQPLLKSWAGQ